MDVSYCEKYKKFILTTDHMAYSLGIDPEGNVQHLYWGAKLPYVEDYPDYHEIGQTVGIGKNLENPRGLSLSNFYYPYEATKAVINEEYAGWGGLNFVEPCLKVEFPDGVRDLVLKYHAHVFKSDDELVVTLKDVRYPLFVHLCYRMFPDLDILVRWAEIENRYEESLRLESVQSAAWHLPDNRAYRLSSLSGHWADEFNLNQAMLQQGKKLMESRRGITSHHETA